MLSAKHWKSRIVPPLAGILLALSLPAAHAVTIGAKTTFDAASSFGATSGSFNVISGGIMTSASYLGSSASANPLTGPLTTVFVDGTGFNGSVTTTNDSFFTGFDSLISILNDTGSAQTVRFRLDYSNEVNADGGDAFADSELVLINAVDLTEYFFSDLKSDTSFGDEIGGVLTGQFGEALTDSGAAFFSFTLAPMEQLDLELRWTLDGGDFLDGLAFADVSAQLTLVPLPGSLLFMVSGMLLLPLQRLFRK